MRRVGIILIILGAVFAVLAGVMLFFLYPRQPQPVLESSLPVVVAFQNIGERTEIKPEQLGKMDWPQHIPTPIGAYADSESVAGKLALVPIYAGQPIIDKSLMDKEPFKETKSNASLILPQKMVAIALPVSVDSSVANAIQAGDRVDILAIFPISPVTPTEGLATPTPMPIKPPIAQRILQDVLILQVGPWPRGGGAANAGGTANNADQAAAIVTFQVSEQDALVIKYIQTQASYFTFALRANQDHTLFNPTPVSIDYMYEHFDIFPKPPGQ